MESPDIDQRLEKILDILIKYHTKLVQQNTLRSQSPTNVNRLKSLLREKSNAIKQAMAGSTEELDPSDTELRECLDELSTALSPWTPETSALSRYWCEMMFEEFPLIISPDHMKRLLVSAKYKEVLDGKQQKPNEQHQAPTMP